MQMTENEICKSYLNALDQTRQVGILADLNMCRKTKIKHILIKHGAIKVDMEELDRKYAIRVRARLKDMELSELEQEQHRHLMAIQIINEQIRIKGAEEYEQIANG